MRGCTKYRSAGQYLVHRRRVTYHAWKRQPPAWEQRLVELGIAVESTVNWPAGGKSVYFRDPDEHLLELATPGIWPNY